MNTSIHGKHLIRRICAAAIVAAAVIVSGHSVTASAQAPKSDPKLETERQKPPQRESDQAQAIEQLMHQIGIIEADLQKTRERATANDPQVAFAEQQLEALVAIQNRIHQLSKAGELKERALAEFSAQIKNIPRRIPPQSTELGQLQQLKDQLAQQEKQLAEREKQLATVAKQLSEQRRPPLPPLDNGTVKIFRFAYANARDAAHTVESLFGTQSLRVAVDERSNLLLVYGKPDVITALDALLSRLDEQASPNGYEKSTSGTASPRSLMLRVFWLADGVPETVGQNPTDFLPKSVLEATHKLGLEAPRLVTQTVNSLATGKDDAVDFSSNVPALLLDQPVGMGCEGKLKLVADDRVRVDMEVHVGGQMMNCDLRGSMATPLGHYMVLGTANSMIAEGGAMAGRIPGAPGMGMGRGAVGPQGRYGGPAPGFGPGPEGEAAPAAGAPVPGGAGPGGEFGRSGADPNAAGVMPQVTKPRIATSRFAFVVHVIEGQSYKAEKAKSDGE